MNESYEFMKQVDVIVLFFLIYGFAINGIVWCVMEVIRFIVKKLKSFCKKRKQKKVAQDEDVTE